MPTCHSCAASVPADATTCGSCGASPLKPRFKMLESRLTPHQEAGIVMQKAFPITLGLLNIGGAAWGLVAIALSMATIKIGALTVALALVMVALYVFSAHCGVVVLKRRPGWLRLNLVLWAMQVPVLGSPVLAYTFATGAFITGWVRLSPSLGAGANAWLGSAMKISLFTGGPFVVGVNILALAVAYYLHRLQRAAAAVHQH